MKKKKILLIGSNGFIGKKLNSYLKKFYSVHKLNRNVIKENQKNILCDITKINKLKRKLASQPKFDYVINLSGQVDNSKSIMYSNIYNANQNIIKYFSNTCSVIIFFSSTLVYGHSSNYVNTKSRTIPISYYAKIKLKTEKLYKKKSKDYLIFRVGNVYDNKFKKKGFLKNIFNSAVKNQSLNINKMDTIRNYIHIDDLIRIVKIIIDKKILNKTINIGHQNISNKAIVRLFEKRFNKKIKTNDLKKNYNFDPNIKLKQDLILKKFNYKFRNNLKKTILSKK